jgi:hypothetical protein
MTPLEQRTIEQWRVAAADLGFTLVAPFTPEDAADSLEYLAWLPQFGSERGMLIITAHGEAQSRLIHAAASHGYGYSCIDASDEPYERDDTIEVLVDWGWSSREDAPDWYTALDRTAQ